MWAGSARVRREEAPCPPHLLFRRGLMKTLAGFCSAAIFGVALCTASTFGQVGMDFNGSTASPAVFHPGDLVEFHVYGPPGAPFASLLSPAPRFEVTPY